MISIFLWVEPARHRDATPGRRAVLRCYTGRAGRFISQEVGWAATNESSF
jgi:hypothetical protein